VPRVDIDWTFHGLDEVKRALAHLPEQAQREIDDQHRQLANRLADYVRSAARASSRQSARAAATVRPGDGAQMVVAGPHPLLFGANFGARGRFGWYSKHRYINSRPRQFRPWIGQGSNDYWFWSTIEAHQAEIDQAWAQALDAIVRAWGA
jgi:hypothetical protein